MNHDESNAKWLPWLVVNDDRIKSLTKMDAIRADEWRVADGMRATNGVGGWNVKQLLSPVKWIVNFSFDNNENRSKKYTQKMWKKREKSSLWNENEHSTNSKEEERAKQLKNSKLKVISQSNRRHSWRLLHREPLCSKAGKWKKNSQKKVFLSCSTSAGKGKCRIKYSDINWKHTDNRGWKREKRETICIENDSASCLLFN